MGLVHPSRASGEAENIFQKAILEQGRGRVLDTLAEIQERHKAVKDLEQVRMLAPGAKTVGGGAGKGGSKEV